VNLRKDHFHAIPHRVHSVNSQAFHVALRRTLGRLAAPKALGDSRSVPVGHWGVRV